LGKTFIYKKINGYQFVEKLFLRVINDIIFKFHSLQYKKGPGKKRRKRGQTIVSSILRTEFDQFGEFTIEGWSYLCLGRNCSYLKVGNPIS